MTNETIHRHDALDGSVRIDGPDRTLDTGRQGRWIAGCPNDERLHVVHPPPPSQSLHRRLVRSISERLLLHVANDADDDVPWSIAARLRTKPNARPSGF